MNLNKSYIMAGIFLISSAIQLQGQQIQAGDYPHSEKSPEFVDEYFGVKVADPYRWLEDDNALRTKNWVEEQNVWSEKYLSNITYRVPIKRRLTQLWNYQRKSVPVREKDVLFFTANDGMQNQGVLYMHDLKNPPALAIFDPNTMSADGTIALSGYKASANEKYLALMVNTSGSDWAEIWIMDLKSKSLLSEKIQWVKFSGIAWKGDGFYYSRYDKPKEGTELSKANEFHKVYYHKIGDAQEKDALIYENKKFPKRNYSADITEDEDYLIIAETESTSGNALHYIDLTQKKAGIKTLVSGFDNDFDVVGKMDKNLLIRTNHKSSGYKLILMDPQNPAPEAWKDLIVSQKRDVLESVLQMKNYLVVKFMNAASNTLQIYDYAGQLVSEVSLPAIGTVGGLSGKSARNDFYYNFTSFTYPNQIFYKDLDTQLDSVWFQSKTGDFKPDDYEVKQERIESKDGTSVPIFIVHKKGLKLDGKNPALLYGYGGFNISLTPSFSVSRLLFLENGGVYVVANIRGGGEFGEDWHKAGTKEQKQNVFDDFIAAAEYLIANKYTSSEKLAIQGGSNGGLLVGACMTQRPELFKVALPAVGVLDMLRYHKFTIGWAWVSDYGSSDDKEGFYYLYKYSPLHNLRKGVKYPATLITTADHDDRVVPAHSFKFAAALQDMNGGNNPQLIRIETKAGHGAGKPTSKAIDEATDVWAFTFFNLGMKFISPPPPAGDPVLEIEDPFDPRRDEIPAYYNDPAIRNELPKPTPPANPNPKK